MGWDVACDLGGAFLDVVAQGEERRIAKRARGAASLPALLLAALEDLRIAPEAVRRVRLASTLAANALLQGTAAPVALVATAGFTDVPDLGRQSRRDPDADPPPPPTPPWLSPRDWRVALRGRIDANSAEVEPIQLEDLAPLLRLPPFTPVAICLLFAHRNPAQERAAAGWIAQRRPDLPLSLSHLVDPAPREFERMLATLADAALKPLAQHHALPAGLPEPWVMQAEGGLAPLSAALARPLGLVAAGPAAGALAVAALVPEGPAIGLDIGSVTADLSLHRDGAPLRARQLQLGEMALRGATLDLESLPLAAPAILAEQVRRLAWRRGIDPRAATLVVGGGAGPAMAEALAAALAPRALIVPPDAAVLAATGLHRAPALAVQREACDLALTALDRLERPDAALAAQLIGWGAQAPWVTHELDLAPSPRAEPLAIAWDPATDTPEALLVRYRAAAEAERGAAPAGPPRILARRSTARGALP
jgi:N-methylhydantoinase A